MEADQQYLLSADENASKTRRSRTPEQRQRRRKMLLRAFYGEFVGTILFFLPIFAVAANGHKSGWSGEFTTMAVALVAGLELVCCIMCFSSISGALFNPAISFSLWLTGKLSNRKLVVYIVAQVCASICCMAIIASTFPTPGIPLYTACSVQPKSGSSVGVIFFAEVTTTFILTYVAFTVAFEEAESSKKATLSVQTIQEVEGLTLYSSTPQSKAGFAPFAIGFVVFALSMYGGASGPAMNPVRMIGPAIFSGVWDQWYVYYIGQFVGAGLAGLTVTHGPQTATQHEEQERLEELEGANQQQQYQSSGNSGGGYVISNISVGSSNRFSSIRKSINSITSLSGNGNSNSNNNDSVKDTMEKAKIFSGVDNC